MSDEKTAAQNMCMEKDAVAKAMAEQSLLALSDYLEDMAINCTPENIRLYGERYYRDLSAMLDAYGTLLRIKAGMEREEMEEADEWNSI